MRLWPLIFSVTLLYGAAIESLQYQSFKITHSDGKRYTVERYVPETCLDVGITPEQIWHQESIPAECIQPLVSTVGTISKIEVDDAVATYGELEVMAFMKAMKDSKGKKLLVDTRSEEWYENETLPGAVNIWYIDLTRSDLFPEKHRLALETLSIAERSDESFDFGDLPELLFFCNGPWCTQSPKTISFLITMGYPPEKLKWYRGGMHSWKSMSLTTTRFQP